MSHQPGTTADGISVVIPTFRSASTLTRVCDELRTHLEPLCSEMEVILVDDGNVDDTWVVVSDLAEQHDWVTGVRLSRNYGQHNALLAGLLRARHALVLTIDDDLQNPPSQVAALVAALDDDVDLVYGTPAQQPQSLGRNLASVMTKRAMSRLLGPEVFPQSSAFRLFRRDLLQAAQHVHDPFISIDVLLSWATTRVRAVEVEFAAREEGSSGYTFRKLVRHAFNMVTGYSTRPLRFVSVLGFAVATFGFVALAFVLIRYAVGESEVAGFTFMAAAITLFSGVQLLSLGILGEYLARMHFRSMGRPAFVVRSVTGHDQPGTPLESDSDTTSP